MKNEWCFTSMVLERSFPVSFYLDGVSGVESSRGRTRLSESTQASTDDGKTDLNFQLISNGQAKWHTAQPAHL